MLFTKPTRIVSPTLVRKCRIVGKLDTASWNRCKNVRLLRQVASCLAQNWAIEKNDWRGWNCHYRWELGVFLLVRELDWDYSGNWGLSISHLALKPSGVRFADVSFRNSWVHFGGIWLELGLWLYVSGLCIVGVVASIGHSECLEYPRSGFRWQSS